MTIYEIDKAMTALIDPETGELLDYDEFCQLQMDRDTKIENMALWVKDLTAENEAIKKEIENLTDRVHRNTSKIDSLKRYIILSTNGEKFSTPRVSISYRSSTSVEITDENRIPDAFIVQKVTTSFDKKALGDALKSGANVPGAMLVSKKSTQIK